MPRKPRKTKNRMILNHPSEMHFLTGVCLICGCQICAGGHGMARPLGREPNSLNDDAVAIWDRNRDRLLAIWRDPAGPDMRESGFSPESHRGAGRTGIPCWGELTFDGKKLPKFDKAWPADVKKVWKELKERT